MNPYDTRLTTPPGDRYTDDEADELEEIYATDPVIRRLRKEIEEREYSLRAKWEDDRNGANRRD